MSLLDYWCITWVLHSAIFGVICFVVILFTLLVTRVFFLHDTGAIVCFVLLFILYVPTSLVFCYVLSHLFDKKDTAQSILAQACLWVRLHSAGHTPTDISPSHTGFHPALPARHARTERETVVPQSDLFLSLAILRADGLFQFDSNGECDREGTTGRQIIRDCRSHAGGDQK